MYATAAATTDRYLALGIVLLLLVPAGNYFTSRQFLGLGGEWIPSLAIVVDQQAIWTLLCTLSGLSLTLGWCLMLVLVRRTRASVARPSST
jgi:hypothetical protein